MTQTYTTRPMTFQEAIWLCKAQYQHDMEALHFTLRARCENPDFDFLSLDMDAVTEEVKAMSEASASGQEVTIVLASIGRTLRDQEK